MKCVYFALNLLTNGLKRHFTDAKQYEFPVSNQAPLTSALEGKFHKVFLCFSPPSQTKCQCQVGQEEGCDITDYILLKVR